MEPLVGISTGFTDYGDYIGVAYSGPLTRAGVLPVVLPYIEDDHHMVWTPTCEFRGPEGFEQFYRCLTANLFDRNHDVSDIKIESKGETATVTFTIHLTAKAWGPPLPKSSLPCRLLHSRRRSRQRTSPSRDYFVTVSVARIPRAR